MSMNLSEEQIKVWWDEVNRLVMEMVIPCVPTPLPRLEEAPRKPKWIEGNVYYTLADDRQFAVESNHPHAVGWTYE